MTVANVSVYLPDALLARARAAAQADRRSLSQWLSMQIEVALAAAARDVRHGALARGGGFHQVDLEELTGALVRKVEAGPASRGRQRKGRKPGTG